jgi:5-methyltetrahydropteroyltriglutamate--homocysteine methyltransferase
MSRVIFTLGLADVTQAFMTSTAPGDMLFAASNAHYPSEEAFLYAMADAMREEYRAITDAGIVLQIDDPQIPVQWDLMIGEGASLAEYQRFCHQRVEALNHALAGVPEDMVRYHICWGSHHGPHSHPHCQSRGCSGAACSLRPSARLSIGNVSALLVS